MNIDSSKYNQLEVPPRLLLGPGPSNAHPRVLQAIGMRQVGHLDPVFLQIMNENQELLKYVWQTENKLTIPVSGTGSAAMEASLANLVEEGDVVLIAVNGYFGERLCNMAERYGADLRKIEKPWGEVFSFQEIKVAIEKHKPAILGIIHAETSTGALQPLDGFGDLCADNDCLLLVDTVTSIGGVELRIDDWNIDVAYGGSQKCLSCPPGISPLTFGPRAVEKLNNRKSGVKNWYLDMSMVSKYWGDDRSYHHTAPINMNYALREALLLVAEEGLETRWQRHMDNFDILLEELSGIGLECYVQSPYRLPSLTTVKVPDGVDAKAVTKELLITYNIEIGNGLGQLAGKVWRIGLMGFNSRVENVTLLVGALNRILNRY